MADSSVVDMLKQDHRKVKELFDEFNEADGRQKAGIAEAALHELEVQRCPRGAVDLPGHTRGDRRR